MPNPLLGLSPAELRSIAEQVRQGRVSIPFTPTSLTRLIPPQHALELTRALNELLSPEGCLDTLAQFREASAPLSSELEIVTTGNQDSAGNTRKTAVVIENLFRDAQTRVLISGYNIFDGKSVLATLLDRMRAVPSLQVELFLNLDRSPEDFLKLFRNAHWPRDIPIPPIYYHPLSLDRTQQTKAVLHSKCVVVDGKRVFLTSANLTEAAYQRNIELGVLLTDASVARQIEEFFRGLVNERTLVPLSD